MQDVQRSISLRDLKWDDVDSFGKKHGFNERSPFVEYCIARTITKKRNEHLFTVMYILMLALMTVLLVLINMRI